MRLPCMCLPPFISGFMMFFTDMCLLYLPDHHNLIAVYPQKRDS